MNVMYIDIMVGTSEWHVWCMLSGQSKLGVDALIRQAT